MDNVELQKIHRVDLHVGEKLKKRRLEKRISQDDLAGSVNLTFQQIQKYEKGTNRISSSKLYDFSKFLEVGIEYFFEGLEMDNYNIQNNHQAYAHDKKSADFYDASSKEEVDTLVNHFKHISDLGIRKNILSLVKSMSGK
ncbi:MAG: transcriptional regulator with XRE-family HTH domain [Candidatus Midichloriaceae bacterium]|jgi:transcriptional regulator with XRE-family HTH domain